MISNGASGKISHPIIVDPDIDNDQWEEFWQDAVNGTVFHSLRFLSYHDPKKFQSHHVSIKRKGNLIGIFPAAVVTEQDGSLSWISHPGASYGGPAWSLKLQYHHLETLIGSLIEYARKVGFKRIKLTPPPTIYTNHSEQSLQFALYRQGFQALRNELTQAVRLDIPIDRLLDSFVNKTRTAYRKAVNLGLQFRIIENPTKKEFDRFYEILVENRAGLGVVPAHTRHEIERLHQLIPEHLMMAVIEKDGQIISEIWNFLCNKYTVLEFYMAHQEPFQELRPVPFLTYHSIIWAHRMGFRYFDFGISSVWGDPTWGLLRFKENFGAKHYLRTTYIREL